MKRFRLLFFCAVLSCSSAFAGSMTCVIKPFNVSVGNGNSPNDLYLLDNTDWYDIGFMDNPWTKSYLAVISIAMNTGKNVTIRWDWTTSETFSNCSAIASRSQYIRYVKTGN